MSESINPDLDLELLVEILRDTLLGAKILVARIKTLKRIYVDRYHTKYRSHRYGNYLNDTSASHQIKNFLMEMGVEQTGGSPSGWELTREKVEEICEEYDGIEVFPLGTVYKPSA